MSTDSHNFDPMLHGYQTPIFGRGDLKAKFCHGTGLFFPDLEHKAFFKNGTPIPAKENAVACTFSFLKAAGDPNLAERAAYLKAMLEAKGATPKVINVFGQRGEVVSRDQLSAFDEITTCPTQFIEFKFLRADEDIARQAILNIDEAAGGRISKHIKLGHSPLF